MRGGRRPGADRKTGSVTKRTREIADGAMASGMMPLEYALAIMRDESQPEQRRDRMAEMSMGYCHARLAAFAVAPAVGNSLVIGSVVINSIATGRFVENGTGVTIEGSVDGAIHDDRQTEKLS
jgi:hypothetical protein